MTSIHIIEHLKDYLDMPHYKHRFHNIIRQQELYVIQEYVWGVFDNNQREAVVNQFDTHQSVLTVFSVLGR